jgi:hypothetical protein
MSKDISIRVGLPPDLKEWVDAQAADIGANAAIWIRMLVVAARKGYAAPRGPQAPPAAAPRLERMVTRGEIDAALARRGLAGEAGADAADPAVVDPDAWRGPVEDEPGEGGSGADVDAIVAGRVAEADAGGLTSAQAYEASGRPPAAVILGPLNGGGARSLRRPPPAYSPAMQPAHLRGLA